jgi:hypothetical protein
MGVQESDGQVMLQTRASHHPARGFLLRAGSSDRASHHPEKILLSLQVLTCLEQ